MKKIILLLLLTACLAEINAQDYQMFYSNRTCSFEHGTYDMLKFIRFDTIKFVDGDSIFIPFKSIQKTSRDCFTPFGATWLGGKIVIEANGDNLLFNYNLDTIRIKPSAKIGEAWTCYSDYTDLIIEARIISKNTQSFLGITDSVKTIAFQAYDMKMDAKDLAINDLSLKLSKKHGVIKTFDFYNFPRTDIYTGNWTDPSEWDLVGLTNPTIGLQNLTWFDVHDFNPGDEIHVEYEISDWLTLFDGDNWNMEAGYTSNTKTKKRYLNRTDYMDSIEYIIEREGRSYDQKNDNVAITYFHDTIREVIQSNPDFDLLPDESYFKEEFLNGDKAAFASSINTTTPLSKRMAPEFGIIWQWDEDESCWSDCCYDGCFINRTYYKGLGGPYGRCSNFDSYGGEELKYVYYKKGDEIWGTPLDLTSKTVYEIDPEICIYPNPANDYLTIESGGEQIDIVTLFDLTGKALVIEPCHSHAHRLILNSINPGIYILSIQSGLNSTQHKIIVE